MAGSEGSNYINMSGGADMKHSHKKWISGETLTKIEERKKKKTAVNNGCT